MDLVFSLTGLIWVGIRLFVGAIQAAVAPQPIVTPVDPPAIEQPVEPPVESPVL